MNSLFKFVPATAGNEKFRGDKRQFGGLLLVVSLCATFFPMAGLTGLIGPDGTTANEGIPLASLIASVCVITIGLSGMLTGYLALIHDYSNKVLTVWVLIIVQTAWIPYITDMTNLGKITASGMGFNLDQFGASESQVHFVGAMGILGIFSYGACFLGSLAFMSFALYAYQAGKPQDRSGSYFRGRLRTYSFLVFVAGLAQLLLGSYTLANFRAGPIVPPIDVAMFTVTFPEMSVFVGILYVINGIWGFYRAFRKPAANDNSYQISIAIQYFFTVVIMIVTQISYLPGDSLAAAAPSRACLTFGASLMPAFLDYKARSTPDDLPENYYGDLNVKETTTKDAEYDVEDGSMENTRRVSARSMEA